MTMGKTDNDDGRKYRRLALGESMKIADYMRTRATTGDDGTLQLSFESFPQIERDLSLMLGKNVGYVSESSVRHVASELGIILIPSSGNNPLSLFSVNSRVLALETALSEAIARIDELERVYIEEGKKQYVLPNGIRVVPDSKNDAKSK